MSELQKYTYNRTLKELVQIENHLEDAITRDSAFCVACLKDKHLLALSGYAEEGVKFFPDDVEIWKDLQQYADDTRDKLLNISTIDFRSEINKARDKRKALIAKYNEESSWECENGVCHRNEEKIFWPCGDGQCQS